ncbi:MAG: hypothetical protein QOD99_1016, partial [Chthoniobacter sp.]|nr:hypothetical protein [Chthoniobacter sp.]
IGAGLAGGTFATPETVVPFALNFVSTTRQIGDIGNFRTIDFDGDGFSDAVYTTKSADQLVVLFGTAVQIVDPITHAVSVTYGFDTSRTIYLNGPANAQALEVADFNGDGHPDIVTASADPSKAGVMTFLSKYDGGGKFLGFHDPLFSPLPNLSSYFFYEKAIPIFSIAAGDFAGDGSMGLALVATETLVPPFADPNQAVVFVLQNAQDASHPAGTGYFFSDFSNATTVSGPFLDIDKVGGKILLKPSALHQGDLQDVLFGAEVGKKFFLEFDFFAGDLTASAIALGKVDTNRDISDPGKIDKISLTDATVLDFAILDISGDAPSPSADPDQNADIAVLTQAPEGMLVTLKGDGTGTFTIGSHVNANGENSGIQVSGSPDKGGLGLTDQKFVGLLATNANGTPTDTFNDLAIIDYGTQKIGRVVELVFNTAAPFSAAPTVFAQFFIPEAPSLDASVLAFDVYRPHPATDPALPGSGPDLVGYGVAIPAKNNELYDFIALTGDGGAILGPPPLTTFAIAALVPLETNGYLFSAGHGGNGLTGAGGPGGAFGTGTLKKVTSFDSTTGITTTTIEGAIDITLPVATAFEALVRLVSGDGGNGFTGGGGGGGISGVSVSYAGNIFSGSTLLLAGHGGRSLTGTGGNGGSMSSLHVATGEMFIAGDGGRGVIGGNGGSIVGNGLQDVVDTSSNGLVSNLLLMGGKGADGIKKGGNGGSIQHFIANFLALTGGVGGLLDYQGGDGGNAIGGPGGTGGSITDSSPLATDNNLAGDLSLVAGRGGLGTSGGHGGSISNFINSPTTIFTPLAATFIAGRGGVGLISSGGAGGSISGIDFSSTGVGEAHEFDLSDPNSLTSLAAAEVATTPIVFDRVIAGQGGDSYGGAGGAGGSVNNAVGTASASAIAVVGGRGGDGLTTGAAGGSVGAATINSAGRFGIAGDIGKVLIIAGEGGDGSGAAAHGSSAQDIALSIGGIAGNGGNGGSITNFTQPSSIHTDVDLIAGNGGNTPHDGHIADLSPKVGKGGSVTGATIAGNIGNLANSATPPELGSPSAIKAYNDISSGERVSDFVRTFMIEDGSTPLDDSVGNVGLVAGAAGRVRDVNGDGVLEAVGFGINGSVSNVHARNIMSMVAGSVDRIASIQSLTNYGSTIQGGILGADKDIDSFGRNNDGHGHNYTIGLPPDFLTNNNPATGVYTASPDPGTKLVDGAIVAKNVRPLTSPRDFIR